MAFGGFEKSDGAPMAEINMIPLVDVMLVLLVIFIITAPVLTHAVKVDLPDASSVAHQETPDAIRLAIDAAGQLHWNDLPLTEAELPQRLRAAAAENPKVELHLRAEKSTNYEILARIMSAAQNNGVPRIGFVTEPE